jgi:hypothetical protein
MFEDVFMQAGRDTFEEAVAVTLDKMGSADREAKHPYLCGVMWNMIRQRSQGIFED